VAGTINVSEGSPFAGADTVDIIVHGIGAHGASPHKGKDPDDALLYNPTKGMGAEDFPFLTTDPDITSLYWQVGGTPREDFEREAAGGEPVPSHHSPLFKVYPESSIRAGVESTVVALMELLGHPGSD
jgi:metal-dependent amidase/aminoacylase/carboxypeptidase family protein